MRGVGSHGNVEAAGAREAADKWRETAIRSAAWVEPYRRAELYDQLAELFDTVGEAEELAQFEDRNTLAVRRQGGR